MKKNGFTLVELMGVIILIGLVAVIAVPTVRNITKAAKQKGLESQINTIIESAKNWATSNTDLLPEVGSILVKMDTLKKEGFLENKEIINPVNNKEINNCVKITYDSDFNQYEYEYSEECPESSGSIVMLVTTSKELEVTEINVCAVSGTCKPGTPFALKVNDTEIYKFYVIADDGNEITLIMDRNLGDNVAWVSKADYNDDAYYGSYGNTDKGPITALNYLNSQTVNWTNIPPIKSYTYENNAGGETNPYGYQKLVITNGQGVLTSQYGTVTTTLTGTSRTRLLTYDEAKDLKTAINNTTPTYLYTNLNSSDKPDAPNGYWFLTTYSAYSYAGRSIRSDGYVDDYNEAYVDTAIGVRPVITLSKSLPNY